MALQRPRLSAAAADAIIRQNRQPDDEAPELIDPQQGKIVGSGRLDLVEIKARMQRRRISPKRQEVYPDSDLSEKVFGMRSGLPAIVPRRRGNKVSDFIEFTPVLNGIRVDRVQDGTSQAEKARLAEEEYEVVGIIEHSKTPPTDLNGAASVNQRTTVQFAGTMSVINTGRRTIFPQDLFAYRIPASIGEIAHTPEIPESAIVPVLTPIRPGDVFNVENALEACIGMTRDTPNAPDDLQTKMAWPVERNVVRFNAGELPSTDAFAMAYVLSVLKARLAYGGGAGKIGRVANGDPGETGKLWAAVYRSTFGSTGGGGALQKAMASTNLVSALHRIFLREQNSIVGRAIAGNGKPGRKFVAHLRP